MNLEKNIHDESDKFNKLGYLLCLKLSDYNLIRQNEIKFNRREDVIGKGAFCIVYKAEYNNVAVAYKTTVREQQPCQNIPTILEHEIKILTSIKHNNIISLLGITINIKEIGIVLEFCEGGTLSDIIHKWRIKDFYTCLKYLRQICDGMSYLHNDSPHGESSGRGIYIHRDLKPQNILVKEKICDKRKGDFPFSGKIKCDECKYDCCCVGDVTLKIADFGLSKMDDMECSEIKGTIPYMAPENHRQICDTKSDVYSFSVILWELIHLKFPAYGRKQENIIEDQRLGRPILEIEGDISPFFAKMFKLCHSYDVDVRPTFYKIKQSIDRKFLYLMENFGDNKINMYKDILREQNVAIYELTKIINVNLDIKNRERIYFENELEKFEKMKKECFKGESNVSNRGKKTTKDIKKCQLNKMINSETNKINILSNWDSSGPEYNVNNNRKDVIDDDDITTLQMNQEKYHEKVLKWKNIIEKKYKDTRAAPSLLGVSNNYRTRQNSMVIGLYTSSVYKDNTSSNKKEKSSIIYPGSQVSKKPHKTLKVRFQDRTYDDRSTIGECLPDKRSRFSRWGSTVKEGLMKIFSMK
uniref:Protein kinase domain-containing protein n=1 Tax=Parastrongyloides trichosuri TaxID=131310 RepID=A0A0N5A638_PARTI